MTTRSEGWSEGFASLLAFVRRWALDREEAGDAVAVGVIVSLLEDLTSTYQALGAELEEEVRQARRQELRLVREEPGE